MVGGSEVSQDTVKRISKTAQGQQAEHLALQYLLRQGLRLLQRNYRVARGPSQRAGEIDLILQDGEGTVVFVEVRARRDSRYGGAAASIGALKRQRLVRTAQHFLWRHGLQRPCRFDVVAVQGDQVQWIPAAFDAQGAI